MESLNLQLILLIAGALIIGYVIWDSKRKRGSKDKEDGPSPEVIEEVFSRRDGSGFDVLGVGVSRIIGEESDGLVAQREEPELNLDDEPMVADRDAAMETEKTSKSQVIVEQPDLIVSMTILARNEDGFNGEKLLHCMLSRGLRFGEMDIFHRHKHTSGEGPVQFSLANALKPGTFNLDDMSSFKTRAVSLFLTLPGPKNPVKAYELMLDTAQHLATELGGQLLDDQKSVLTQQTILHFKEQILEFERKRNSQA